MTSKETPPTLPVEKGNYETTAPVFAKGLVSLLQPVVAECDERVQAVLYSQRELSKQLDMLSAELDRFMEVSRTPLIGNYIEKLLRAKERMIGINILLGNIQQRLETLQRENSTLPPSKLPPITIPSSNQAPSPSEGKRLLGVNVNQPQFLSSWLSKAKSLVPDTQSPTTTTSTTTTKPPPTNNKPSSTPPTATQEETAPEEEKQEATTAEEKAPEEAPKPTEPKESDEFKDVDTNQEEEDTVN